MARLNTNTRKTHSPVPPIFPPPPPIIHPGGAKSSRKRKEARIANVPFPSSVTEDENRPRRVPQMSTARGQDGGRMQSGGVNLKGGYCAGCRAG